MAEFNPESKGQKLPQENSEITNQAAQVDNLAVAGAKSEKEPVFTNGITRANIKNLNMSRYSKPGDAIHHMYGPMEYYPRGIVFNNKRLAFAIDDIASGVNLHANPVRGLQLSRVEDCEVEGLEGVYPGMFFRANKGQFDQEQFETFSELFVRVVNKQLEVLCSPYQIPE